MKRVRALFRSGRFLVPATVLLGEGGVLSVLLRPSVMETSRVKGSLSSREIGAIVSSRVDVSLRECDFSTRRVRRRMELLDVEERGLLKHLDVDLSDLMKRGRGLYEEVYLVRVRLPGLNQDITLIADRRNTALLENYLARHCSRMEGH